MDGWQVGFGAVNVPGQVLEAVVLGGRVGRFGGVDVGALAGAGETDGGAFAGGALADGEMGGVGGPVWPWARN